MKRESSWRGLVLVGFLSLLLTTVSLQHALGSGQKEPSKDVKEEEAGRPVTPRLNAPADLTILSKAVLAAEDLMQQGLYSEAASELAAAQVPEDEQAYAVWLHALSLFRASNIDDALTLCLEAMARWGGNPWIHKIRYLAAQIYIQKRDFTKAEEIYADAARRLLAEGRKEDIARIYIQFAQTLSYSPRPEELDVPQPDYNQAHLFYQKALELEIGPTLREEVRFQMARMREKEGRYGDAVSEYRSYLQEFDEDWGKTEAGREGKPPAFVGLHRGESRYRLAESLIKTSQLDEARRELENLLHLLSEAASAKSMSPSLQVSSRTSATNQDDLGEPEAIRTWHRLVLRRIPYTYAFPNPPTQYALESGLASITEFLRLYPDDSIAVTLAWYSVTALNTYGRTDDTIRSARDFISPKGFSVLTEEPPQEAERRREVGIDMNPAEQFDLYQKKAHFLIGALLLAQRDYPSAIEAYTEYIQKFPNGPDWTNAQRGIINAEYGRGIDLVVARKYDEAMNIWNVFLVKYPLDSRSRQILFTMGQIDYQRGKELKTRGQWQEAKEWFLRAIAGFRRLVAKYPGTEEAGLAQLRIGEILENELGDLKGALEAYRFLTWSSSSGIASARAQTMAEKELVVRTDRIYRTNEPAVLALQMRNVQSVTVKSYRLNLKDYFLKFHSIRGVENLDLPLISPDKTWEVPIKGYSDYLPIQQSIEIPMEGPGVYAANIAEPDLEATTLLIRSDIDLIVKSSKTELLVFVQNMRTNQPVQNAKVMVTDGTKLLLEGDTGSDGVLYRRMEELKGVETLCVLAEKNGDIASNNLSLAGLGFSRGLAPKGYIYADRPVYRPGETVFLRGNS